MYVINHVFPHLLWAHVEFCADLACVSSQERCRRQGTLIIILLLVHGCHQAEVSNLHHIIHSEEDVGGLESRW